MTPTEDKVGNVLVVRPDAGHGGAPSEGMLRDSGLVPPDTRVYHLRPVGLRRYAVRYAVPGAAFSVGDIFVTGKDAGCLLEFIIGGRCSLGGGAIGAVESERNVRWVNIPWTVKARAVGQFGRLMVTVFAVAAASPFVEAGLAFDSVALGLPPCSYRFVKPVEPAAKPAFRRAGEPPVGIRG